jgi:zinc protease
VPANATLAIAGDFDVAAAKAAVAKWFGTMPTSTKPTPVRIPAPRPKAARIELTDAFAKLPQLTMVWHSPASFAPGDAELDIAADALTREGTGRLYRILVHERQLAQGVVAYQQSAGFSSQFNITVTLRSGADAKLVEQIVRDEVQKLATEPLSARERDRAVTNIEADFVRGLEGLLARAERLQTYNHFLGDPGAIDRDMHRYRAATVEQVRQTVASTLVLDQAVVALTNPAPAPAATKEPTDVRRHLARRALAARRHHAGRVRQHVVHHPARAAGATGADRAPAHRRAAHRSTGDLPCADRDPAGAGVP